MKKFTAILTAIVIALFLVSCGGSSKKENEQETPDGDETADTGEEEDDGDDNGDENACKLDKDLLTLDTAADRYLAFKGIGILNPTNPNVLQNRNAQPATQVKFDAAGMPETSFQYATTYSFYDFGYSANYQEDLVTLTIVGDVTTEGYIKTIAFVSVPVSYVDYMKQNEVYELAQAPMTQVLNLKRSNDGKYMQQCLFASKVINNQYVSGKMKICYDNKELAVGGTFKMSMVSEIASDQETVDTFTDINSLDDLCSCYDLTIESDNDEDARVSCEGIDWNKAADDKCEDPNAEKNANGECVCKDGFETNEETKKCEKKEEEVDPCKDVKCENEGDVCVADATDADKGYKCEPKAECKDADNEVLNEKTNKCDCKEGFERNEETKKCEKKEDAPATDEAACTAEGGTWANNTCNCGADKTWDATEKKCKTAAPVNPDKAACEAEHGTWTAANTCDCGANKTWEATEKKCKEAAPVNANKVLCEETEGTWAEDACNCGTGKVWDATDGCKADAPAPTPAEECVDGGGNWDATAEECNCTEGTWNDTDKTCESTVIIGACTTSEQCDAGQICEEGYCVTPVTPEP